MTKQKFLESLEWNFFDGTFLQLMDTLWPNKLQPFVVQFQGEKPEEFNFVGDFNYRCGSCSCCNFNSAPVARYAFLWRDE